MMPKMIGPQSRPTSQGLGKKGTREHEGSVYMVPVSQPTDFQKGNFFPMLLNLQRDGLFIFLGQKAVLDLHVVPWRVRARH